MTTNPPNPTRLQRARELADLIPAKPGDPACPNWGGVESDQLANELTSHNLSRAAVAVANLLLWAAEREEVAHPVAPTRLDDDELHPDQVPQEFMRTDCSVPALCGCMSCSAPGMFGRMFCCPKCGNKRCPKAAFHGNACNNSNDLDQVVRPEPASPPGEDKPSYGHAFPGRLPPTSSPGDDNPTPAPIAPPGAHPVASKPLKRYEHKSVIVGPDRDPVAASSAGEDSPDASGLYHSKAHVDLPGKRAARAFRCEPAECHKVQARLIEERDDALAKLAAEERGHLETIARRDRLEERLDDFARQMGEDAGEHSSCNDPWSNALEEFGRLQLAEQLLTEKLAASEARCEQLTGELAEAMRMGKQLGESSGAIILSLSAKLTESEAAVARLREELGKREAVIWRARNVLIDWRGASIKTESGRALVELDMALSALDQPSQLEPVGEPRPVLVGSTWRFNGCLNGNPTPGMRVVHWVSQDAVHALYEDDRSSGTQWTMQDFINLHTWISDPPPVSDTATGET